VNRLGKKVNGGGLMKFVDIYTVILTIIGFVGLSVFGYLIILLVALIS
jgi:hypothetical protein